MTALALVTTIGLLALAGIATWQRVYVLAVPLVVFGALLSVGAQRRIDDADRRTHRTDAVQAQQIEALECRVEDLETRRFWRGERGDSWWHYRLCP